VEENGKICFEVLVLCYPEVLGGGGGQRNSPWRLIVWYPPTQLWMQADICTIKLSVCLIHDLKPLQIISALCTHLTKVIFVTYHNQQYGDHANFVMIIKSFTF